MKLKEHLYKIPLLIMFIFAVVVLIVGIVNKNASEVISSLILLCMVYLTKLSKVGGRRGR